MLESHIYADRRQRLSAALSTPILLMGNGERPRNLPMSTVAFRQDSSFLYFSGCSIPGASMLIVEGKTTLYLPPPADDDALWHGVSETIEEMGSKFGIHDVRESAMLEDDARALSTIATIAVPDLAQTQRAASIAGHPLVFGKHNGDDQLIDTIIAMRRITSDHEIQEMKATAIITDAAHRAAMAATRPGDHERNVAAAFAHVVHRAGLTLAYPTICTVRGEVLHNFHYENPLQDGQLLLLDGGAEATTGYATDVTRTWPVSGSFTGRQRAAYDAVLEAQLKAIDLVRAGTRYRDVHTCASLVLAQFLADEGLINISPEAAVECGAQAIFFPHGVGHLIGLDVHDLENFGDRAAYPPGRERSNQFGTCYLRLDLDLEPGMVVTVEPGFYVVPAILNDDKLRTQFASQVNFSAAESWVGFGGIRIEDDVLVTHGEPDVLTGAIPKHPDEMLAIVGK